MAKVPNFQDLADSLFRKVLRAHGTYSGEFLRMTPPNQEIVWEVAWTAYQESLDSEFEAPTSASAKFENEAAKENRRQKKEEPAAKDRENEKSPVETRGKSQLIKKGPLANFVDQTFFKSQPNETESATPRKGEELGEQFDLDELFGQWLELVESTPIAAVEFEQQWTLTLPESLVLMLRRLTKEHRETLADMMSLGKDENRSVLETGYVPAHTHWELLQRLDDDSSGFGDIWLAVHDITEEVAVCKFPKERSMDNLNVLVSLENEARLASKISHPGIVKLRETHLRNPEMPFIVFDYVPGKDLAYALLTLLNEPVHGSNQSCQPRSGRNRQFTPLAPDQAATVMLKLVDIIAAAHSVSPTAVVHRDLKPQNILISNYDDLAAIKSFGITPDFRLAELKVLDFGISGFSTAGRGATTIAQSIAREFDMACTEAYASPQQKLGELPEESDDVYALGLIWYELLSGEIANGPPTGRWSSRVAASGTTADQIAVLEGCLEESRQHRIQNAINLAKQIRRAYPDAENNPDIETWVSKLCDDPSASHLFPLRIDLAKLTSLSPPSPAILPLIDCSWSHIGRTPLDEVSTLPLSIAKVLNRWRFSCIDLSGLTLISPEAARELEQSLEEEFFLDKIQELSPDAAAALSRAAEGATLSLNGLKSLSPELAKALAVGAPATLVLNGLQSLSVPAACEIARSRAGELHLEGIESLNTERAYALAKFKGDSLYLDGLADMTASVATAIADFCGSVLSLCGMSYLSIETAGRLVAWSGEQLILDGLNNQGGRYTFASAIVQISQWKGLELNMGGIKLVQSEEIESEATRRGCSLTDLIETDFSLNTIRLTTLTEAVAQAIVEADVQHEVLMKQWDMFPNGDFSCWGLEDQSVALLDLSGLSTLSEEASAQINRWGQTNSGQIAMIDLSGLGKISEGVAWNLIKWGIHHFDSSNLFGDRVEIPFNELHLVLDGLTELSGNTSKILGSWGKEEIADFQGNFGDFRCSYGYGGFEGSLNLNGLKELSLRDAKYLARFTGYKLELNGLTELTVDVARALLKFGLRCNGVYVCLKLNGLKTISKEVAKELANWEITSYSREHVALHLEGLVRIDRWSAEEFSKSSIDTVVMSKELAIVD